MNNFILLFLFFPMLLPAQYRMQDAPDPGSPVPYESDILTARPIWYFVAGGIGALMFQHNGEFSPAPERCLCVFSDLSETQFHYAAEFSIRYPKLGFGLKFLFQYMDVSGRFEYIVNRSALIGDDQSQLQAEFRKSSDVDLEYISFTPSIAWYLPKTPVFVHGGLEIGHAITARYDNQEEILTPGYSYDTTKAQFEYSFLDKTEIQDLPSLRFGLHIGAGVDIKLSKHWSLTPQGGATIPLNPVSNKHEEWTISSVFGLILLKYRI